MLTDHWIVKDTDTRQIIGWIYDKYQKKQNLRLIMKSSNHYETRLQHAVEKLKLLIKDLNYTKSTEMRFLNGQTFNAYLALFNFS